MSGVTCHKKKSGGASRWRVCYQRGLPRLVFTELAPWADSVNRSGCPCVRLSVVPFCVLFIKRFWCEGCPLFWLSLLVAGDTKENTV